jgi:CBS domain-containing protein
MKVRELMTEDLVTVGPETSLKDVATILAELGISGLPVIGEGRTVVGVVSEADILVKEQGSEPHHGGFIGWLLEGGRADSAKLSARTAGEAMTAPAITIGADREVSEAARLMVEHGIKRLPVVDSDGKLAGIVTRSDLVRAFARPDDEIEHEIREEVVRRALWIEDDALEIGVRRGEVTLGGQVERKSDAELLARFAARVPGVISVSSTLGWERDDHKTTVPGSDPHVPIPPRRA